MAIMGGYFSLYVLFSLKSAMTKKPIKAEPTTAAAVSAGGSDEMPSVESPDFEAFLNSDRLTKFLEK
jgi:hypothetical protein